MVISKCNFHGCRIINFESINKLNSRLFGVGSAIKKRRKHESFGEQNSRIHLTPFKTDF